MCQVLSRDEADQPQLNTPAKEPADYVSFWNLYRKHGYGKVQAFLGNRTIRGQIQIFAVTVIYRLRLDYIAKHIKRKIMKLKSHFRRKEYI